jgi:PAS domain S-box-containing protein
MVEGRRGRRGEADKHQRILELEARVAELEATLASRSGAGESEQTRGLRELLLRTVDAHSDAVYWLDSDNRIFYVNEAGCRALGHERQELLGRPIHEVSAGATPEALAEAWAQLRRDGHFSREAVHRRKDGSEFRVEVTGTYVRCDGREYHCGLVRDVGESRRVEEALRDSEREFRAFFDTVAVGAVQLDLQGRFLRVNDRYCEMTGYAREELLAGMSPADLSLPDDRARDREYIAAVLEGRPSPAELEKCVVRKDGTLGWVVVRANGVRDASGRIARTVAVVQDLTERKRAEEALRESEQTLREADRRKDDFLAVLSHELRNPLAPIQSGLYVLERTPPGSEQARKAEAVIQRQARHLTRLVDDLLDVTRITRGKVQLHRERIELGEVVRRTMDDHRVAFEASGIALEGRFGSELLWVNADPTRLAQVLGNLLGNAVKFTPRGGKVEVRLERDQAQVVLRIRDTGVGIAAEVRGHLFEPFMQAPQTLDRSRGGLGLGLALVKGLVELHGGSVGVESPGLGQGSEFVVRLPCEAARTETALAAEPGRARRRRVLVIEDNVDAADSLQAALELGGHEVQVAYDGPAGLAAAGARRPDVVLCDIGLPGMSGYEVAAAFRADEGLRDAVLVAVSGYALPEDRQRALDAGFVQHIAKPPSMEALERVMK